MQVRLPALAVEHQRQGAGNGIGNVVMTIARMIDHILHAPRLALQGDQLGNQARVIKQVNQAGIDRRQEIQKDVALRLFGRLVENAAFADCSRHQSAAGRR